MFARCWIVYLFLHLIGRVSLQDTEVSGAVGGSVILPCSYKERELQPDEINVFWRFNESKIVYDIEKGISSKQNQDEMFKNRIELLSSLPISGNFSLRLSSLKHSDQGQFSCDIIDVDKEHKVTLKVREIKPTVSTPNPKADARNSSMKAQPERILAFLMTVLFSFFFLH